MDTDRRRAGVVRGPVASRLSNDAGDIRQCETARMAVNVTLQCADGVSPASVLVCSQVYCLFVAW